jgi:hypothetical protein
MRSGHGFLVAGGVLLTAVALGAATAAKLDPQNKVMFPYREAADPKVVVESYQGPGNLNAPI